MSKKALENRADLEFLLGKFYERVRADQLIGPVFDQVAIVDWPSHELKIYNFWDSLLFGAENYDGRPFPPHIPLNLRVEHFQRWLELFFFTVDESFEGHKADEIKNRAYNIGRNFMGKLDAIRNSENI